MLSIVWNTYISWFSPPTPTHFRGKLEILGWSKRGKLRKIVTFRGNLKFKVGSWTSYIWKISHSLYDNLYDGSIGFGIWEWKKFWNVVLILRCDFQFIWFFCLEFHFPLKINSSSSIRIIWCFAGTVTLTICMLVLYQ